METELNRLKYQDSILSTLRFAWSFPSAQVAFSSELSRHLLYATILDIISTSCAYVLSLWRASSPQPHAERDRARRKQAPQHFDAVRANRSLFASLFAFLASHRVTRKRKNPFSQIFLGLSLRWSRQSITRVFECSAAQSVDYEDQ